MTSCITLYCPNPAEDEYHWFETLYLREKVLTVEVVWNLCEECCEFVESVVECISNLEEELEREAGENGTGHLSL